MNRSKIEYAMMALSLMAATGVMSYFTKFDPVACSAVNLLGAVVVIAGIAATLAAMTLLIGLVVYVFWRGLLDVWHRANKEER